MTGAELTALSIADLQRLLRRKEVSPVEALDALIERIHQVDEKVGAYLSVDEKSARAEAERADVNLPLGGVPLAIKDLINVSGQPCTCGSKILGSYRAPYDATVVQKLRRAGAIPFGKTNLDEFAMGSSTEHSAFKLTRNPWDLSRVPGGSSGGSAAAVAAGEAFGALGTDTGGSVRQPAAFCGVVGLKPSYGLVSRFGVTAFASSLDQVGPLTKSVRDSAMLMNAIAGHDPQDSTSSPEQVTDYVSKLDQPIRGIRIGLPREYLSEGIDPGVKAAIEAATKQLQTLGAEIVELSLPHTEQAVAVYYVLATAEASANLARFDGVRYGLRSANAQGILDQYVKTRAEGFGSEVKRRIILGTYVLSGGYYEAYYDRAQKVRQLIRRDFANAFKDVDVLMSPTTPTAAFRFGERHANPLQMYLADIFTIAANLAGICGISIPCGFDSTSGRKLPVGLQFLGRPFDEARLLQVAYAYEQSTGWHQMRPVL
jgi:aspartyl-tRNA(Asn)/glutamyl-tRNA(Gln) amidotransferase subunit A